MTGGLKRTSAPVDSGTEGRDPDRKKCGTIGRHSRTNWLHICTRKLGHPGTHYDETEYTWFGQLIDGSWKFIVRLGKAKPNEQRHGPPANPNSNQTKYGRNKHRREYG